MNVETCQRIIDSSFALLTWCNGPGFSWYNLVQRSLAARPKSSLFNSFLFRPRLVAYHRGLFGLIHSIKNRRLTVFLTKTRICEVLGLWDFPGLFFLCLPLLFFFGAFVLVLVLLVLLVLAVTVVVVTVPPPMES